MGTEILNSRKKGVSAIAKQRTYTDADREQAFAEYTVLGNWELVSRKMGIPVNTLKSWWRRHPPDMDEYAEKRREVREGFIETASRAIENGAELINRRMELALKHQQELDDLLNDIPDGELTMTQKQELRTKIRSLELYKLNEISTAIGTLYDKRALAQGQSTENTTIEIKMPQDVMKYAE